MARTHALVIVGLTLALGASIPESADARPLSNLGQRVRQGWQTGRQRLASWRQQAAARLPGKLRAAGRTLRHLAGVAGDRVAARRGAERGLVRAEQLYERGNLVRSLGVLRSVLRSKRTDETQRARALLYTGAVQSMLGNQMQATRAFAGLRALRPDFQLPEGTAPEIQNNFAGAGHVLYSGAVRGEAFAAELPGRVSVLNRLRGLRATVAGKVEQTIATKPALAKLHANTVGRLNVWRALNTLEMHGVPRFPVKLEPDSANPRAAGQANMDGTVNLDYSQSYTYARALETLAHEAYHLNSPIALTEEYAKALERYDRVANKANAIRQQGAQTPRADKRARSKLARKLNKTRHELQRAMKPIRALRVQEEGEADAFAGRVLGRENLPLTRSAWSISHSDGSSRWHPTPRKRMKSFLDGAREGIQEFVDLPPGQ
jgi:hypothetical protein